MNCEKSSEYISALADGELSSAERRELAEHIKGCPDCEKRLKQMKLLKEMLSEMRVEDPYDLHETIMGGIKKAEAQRKAGVRKKIFGALAAACVVFAFAFLAAPNFSKLYLFGVKSEKSGSDAAFDEEAASEAALDTATEESVMQSMPAYENAAEAPKSAPSAARSAGTEAFDADNGNAPASGMTEREKYDLLTDDAFSNYIAFSGNAELPNDFGNKETEYDPVKNRTYIFVSNDDFKDAVAKISAAGFVLTDFDFPEPSADAERSLILICGDN